MTSSDSSIDPNSPNLPTGTVQHPRTAETPPVQPGPVYQCRFCGMMFRTQAELEEHLKSHEPGSGRTSGGEQDTGGAGIG